MSEMTYSKRFINGLRICSECNKSFEVKLYDVGSGFNINFLNCPHCGKRNDIWLLIQENDKPAIDEFAKSFRDVLKPLQHGIKAMGFKACDMIDQLSQALINSYIEQHGLEKCDFNDGCDSCKKPNGGIWVSLSHIPEDVTEANYYICRSCILKKALKLWGNK